MAGEERLQLAIMRHGAIPANREHRYAGLRIDESLSEEGVRQARAAGICPGLPLVYVSPLARARQTARICFPHASLREVEGLGEMDFGAFEGRNADEMADDAAYRVWVDGMCEGRCPGGETRSEFAFRTVRAVEWVLSDARREGLDMAMVVAHGGTVMSTFDALAKRGRAGGGGYFSWHVGNCQGYRAEVVAEDGTLVLRDPQRFEDLGFVRRLGGMSTREGHPDGHLPSGDDDVREAAS